MNNGVSQLQQHRRNMVNQNNHQLHQAPYDEELQPLERFSPWNCQKLSQLPQSKAQQMPSAPGSRSASPHTKGEDDGDSNKTRLRNLDKLRTAAQDQQDNAALFRESFRESFRERYKMMCYTISGDILEYSFQMRASGIKAGRQKKLSTEDDLPAGDHG
ncbi:hypothetical protein PRZ48_008945 [Zasmidium cellare]|uniref:Uncharacterized protein n=1 Tax=Zasmidium cellare TaxID=395010 RepID=A0ABR0EHK9_ZASCE|nr:hypothetical protein PRZ48_008945 [Zasmidium cellare]